MPASNRPPEIQALLDDLERQAAFTSIEDLNRHLAARTHDYNTTPQADLGGLSPDEMSQLLYGDWTTKGALRLNDALTLADLPHASFLHDARTVLEFIATEGPVKETAAQYLPRAVVAKLLPLMHMPAQRRMAVRSGEPVPKNEGDALWLSPLRYTLQFAGLLMRRKGLRATPLGRDLLREDRAGALYSLLFRTFFQTFDLRGLSNDDAHPGLQSTVAFTFYKLRASARDWQSAESLAESAWLGSAKEPASEWEQQNGDLRFYTLRHRVLDPLVQFGLLEDRAVPSAEAWREAVEYRCTPLHGRFLRFEFRGQKPRDPFLMR